MQAGACVWTRFGARKKCDSFSMANEATVQLVTHLAMLRLCTAPLSSLSESFGRLDGQTSRTYGLSSMGSTAHANTMCTLFALLCAAGTAPVQP